MAYRVFTDSCSDLPKEYAIERELSVIPLRFHMEGKDYLDDFGQSMSCKEFYGKLRAGATSTTTQINTEQFLQTFTPVLAAGEDVLYIAFSSALSGTYQSANLAAEELRSQFPDRTIAVVDSLCASMGQGLLVHHALDNRDKGMTLEQSVAWLEENKGKLCHWFTVYDLNHLRRGGRVSAAAAFLGTMLSIKPVLHVDDAGRLIPVEKVKGRARSIRALLDHMKATAIRPEEQVIFISHGDSEADARALADSIRQQWNVKDIKIHTIGPVIGSHSGPDTIALFFLGEPR
ncbi:MAG: DegV family protein [Candidatus Spyradocola sp.]|jgi:DegV family protein with EDD domain